MIPEIVNFVHDIGYSHCDIKLENIVFDETIQNWKLIDFGCSELLSDNNDKYIGTIPYRLPYFGNIDTKKKWLHGRKSGQYSKTKLDQYAVYIMLAMMTYRTRVLSERCVKCIDNEEQCNNDRHDRMDPMDMFSVIHTYELIILSKTDKIVEKLCKCIQLDRIDQNITWSHRNDTCTPIIEPYQ